jgi:2'-5' RNA ligase/predicted GNAT family acetyltransferase
MPRQRLGVVLLFPPPVAAEVDVLRRAVGADDVERLPPHLTLVPPVNVRDDDMASALDLLRDAAARTLPFRLVLGPPRTFLPINPVLYLEVGGDVAAVDALRDKVFRPPLERSLTWPFQPHVTLLDGGDEAFLRSAQEVLSSYRAELLVERVHLLREQNDEGVRSWRPIAEASFGEPAVVGRGGLELTLEVGERLSVDVPRPLSVTARRSGVVVGTAVGGTDGDVATLSRVDVDASVRGEGIGRQLVAAFASAAADRGARVLVGPTGNGFLEALGFVDGRRDL